MHADDAIFCSLQVIDDAAALATISGSIPKQISAAPDSAPQSHRPQSGECQCDLRVVNLPLLWFNSHTASSRPGSASSRPQSATSRGSTVTPRSEFVVQTVAKQDHSSVSRPSSARAAEVESEKISESDYVSVRPASLIQI